MVKTRDVVCLFRTSIVTLRCLSWFIIGVNVPDLVYTVETILLSPGGVVFL